MTFSRVPTHKGTVAITQGQYAVSGDPDCILSTILGSCVSTCLWDPHARVGGMNHILVARSAATSGASDMEGINAMELLINALVRMGAVRSSLQAKVFGGARMISGLSDIGEANGTFVLEYLSRESIACLGKSLGGASARQIKFRPSDGKVLLKTVGASKPAEVPPDKPNPGNGVELF
ncbi:chemotaxis protein CheD [Pseudooceanicola pacificus]|uniref:chemotaxis protein CheD n=1 Tax=Pseudooceanicola pacificus TaxID=2676438 RepID=UPI002E254259